MVVHKCGFWEPLARALKAVMLGRLNGYHLVIAKGLDFNVVCWASPEHPIPRGGTWLPINPQHPTPFQGGHEKPHRRDALSVPPSSLDQLELISICPRRCLRETGECHSGVLASQHIKEYTLGCGHTHIHTQGSRDIHSDTHRFQGTHTRSRGSQTYTHIHAGAQGHNTLIHTGT